MKKFIAAVLGTVVFAAGMVPMYADDKDTGAKEFTDANFVTMAASSGMKEVELSRIVAEKTKNDAVKQFAERLVADHTKANETLKTAARDAGATIPDKATPEQQKQIDAFRDSKGDNLDREYITQMVQSHEKGIALYTQASKEAKNQQIRDFATKTLPTLQEHLKLAKQLQEQIK